MEPASSAASNDPDYYQLTLLLPATVGDSDATATAPALSEAALAFTAMRDGGQTGPWRLSWLFDGPPDEAFVRDALGDTGWTIEPVANVNWLAESYRQFPAFTVGPFFIYGSHHTDAPPVGLLPLQIDAATAFGSGEHGTTAGCLLALAGLREGGFAPARILDLGCGSGILAIAAARLWPDTPVAATDIDEEAAVVSTRHIEMNDVASQITADQGDGFAAPGAKGSFDLVIANILAGPLIGMAENLVAAVTPGGCFILSGLLTEQSAEVSAAYQAQSAELLESFTRDGWVAQLWRR